MKECSFLVMLLDDLEPTHYKLGLGSTQSGDAVLKATVTFRLVWNATSFFLCFYREIKSKHCF